MRPCLRVSYFVFGTIPPSKFENFDTSPYANPQNSTALVSGNPVHKGGEGWCASAQTRRGTPFTVNIIPARHPERAPARRSFGSGASRNGQNQAPWRAGIYEEICTDSSIQRNIFVLLGVLREGKVTSPMKSHKDFFVDPCTLCRFCVGSLRLIVIIRSKVQGSLSKTSLRSG